MVWAGPYQPSSNARRACECGAVAPEDGVIGYEVGEGGGEEEKPG